MIDFGTLDRAEAQAYHEAYVAAVPDRVAWLAREVRRTGGPEAAVDGSPESLGPLWAWLRGRLEEQGGPRVDLPGRPPWYDPARPNPHLGDGALWLVDAVGCYLAVLVLSAVPDARWELYRVAKRFKDVMQNRTVLAGSALGRPADPARMVYTAVIRTVIHDEPWDPAALRGLYDSLVNG
ncbi:hypothetical protein [Georgenia subflava]|uniref:Uncharacterized protein n=1 Tax=Georgenia subflava TaxID=1622177 RepID=A0A6N7EN79_9MICO|nr:hypothetical protein [Georgenia subflava]MPV38553.1 hypothetical protein [Georgenia subflava]